MTATFFVKTFLELVAIVLLAYGFLHEDKIALWERRQWKRFRRATHKMSIKLRKAIYNWICRLENELSK